MNRVIGPKKEKLDTLIAACEWFTPGRMVSGKSVEKMLGHFCHEALYNRSTMGIFKAAYIFVRDSYNFKSPLWSSVSREFLIAAGLLPLSVARLDLKWSGTVRATDACETGWGACSAEIGTAAARSHGLWNERWRFRRLRPDEWAPRRRALRGGEGFETISDFRTLGQDFSQDARDFDESCPNPVRLGPIPTDFDFAHREGFPEVRDVLDWNWKIVRGVNSNSKNPFRVKRPEPPCGM